VLALVKGAARRDAAALRAALDHPCAPAKTGSCAATPAASGSTRNRPGNGVSHLPEPGVTHAGVSKRELAAVRRGDDLVRSL
jgi:hypothetical protein